MINVKLTKEEYQLIRDALTTEYYHAKDEMNDDRKEAITELEIKLIKSEATA